MKKLLTVAVFFTLVSGAHAGESTITYDSIFMGSCLEIAGWDGKITKADVAHCKAELAQSKANGSGEGEPEDGA